MTAHFEAVPLFDAYYYAHGCGPRPYQRDEVWLAHFDAMAMHIVRTLQPATVLDAGCAFGFLVECLRRRGVEAYGIDVSAYAIAQVHPDVKDWCRTGSIAEPLDRNYDLITCIEVLEHLSPDDAERAIANLCAHSKAVLFSSSPSDFLEPTHINVQPPEYWAEMFARHGFYHDVNCDVTFVTPWAVLFSGREEPVTLIVRDYERRLRQLQHQNQELRLLARERDPVASPDRPENLSAFAVAPVAAIPGPLPSGKSAGGGENATGQRRVLLISQDVVGKVMAGPGVRYWKLAGVLAKHFAVTLAIPADSLVDASQADFNVMRYRRSDWQSIQKHVEAAEVIIFPTDIAHELPRLADCAAALVVDGYDPILSEWLALTTHLEPAKQEQQWRHRMRTLMPQYLIGDYYICTSERQRDWWLGLLEASGRINPHTYRDDPSLRQLVDVVPFGVEDYKPQHRRALIKGVWRGIGGADRVVVWGGGLWTWLDPLTAIRAMARVVQQRDDVRLVFPGTRRPNSILADIPTYSERAHAVAQELGLSGKFVFFGEWTPYEDWLDLLLECDVALSLHHDTFESRLALRSRIADYIAARLPIIATSGDASADLITLYGLGELVEPEDAGGVAKAMLHLLQQPRSVFENAFNSAHDALRWEHVAQPLIEFCRTPKRAPDRAQSELGNPFYLDQLAAKDQRISDLKREVKDHKLRWTELEQSLGYPLLKQLQQMRARLAPPLSRREHWLLSGAQAGLVLRQRGPLGLARQALQRVKMTSYTGLPVSGLNFTQYARWIEQHEPTGRELERQRSSVHTFEHQPLISIITPVFDPPPHVLRAMLDSVFAQTYANWELCVVDAASSKPEVQQMLAQAAREDPRVRLLTLERNLGIARNSNAAIEAARGEYIALLDHDDVLAPFALYAVVKTLNDNPDCDVVYSDHDVLSNDGRARFQPLFKPGWSPAIMLSANYMTHLTIARTSLVRAAGGFCCDLNGAQDWDLFLRLSERTTRIVHIPEILYHWRESANSTATDDKRKPYAREAQLQAIGRHLQQLGLADARAFVDGSGFIRVAWQYARTRKVSVIIPSNGAGTLLVQCLGSILSRTRYSNFEVVVVNNGARRPDEFDYYARITKDPRVRVVHDERAFNYSAANNFGARVASGEILVFLNNDTQVLTEDWLDELVMWLSWDEIGAVGAKLLLPDGKIQHAGVILGMDGFAGHVFAGDSEGRGSIFGFAEWYRDYLAVTGACLAMRRETFERIGGFDERFVLCGSDVELCLRARAAGLRVVYNPFVRIRHHDKATRGGTVPASDFRSSYTHYQPFLQNGDPYFSPNLSCWSSVPALRKQDEPAPLQFAQTLLARQAGTG